MFPNLKGKKIVLFVPLLGGGGAEIVFVNLANYLVEQNLEVTLFYAYGDSFLNRLDKRVSIHPVTKKSRYAKNRHVNKVVRIVQSFIGLCRLLKNQKPDFLISAVHESNMIAYFANRKVKYKSKLIVSIASIYEKNTLPFFLRPVLKHVFKKTNTRIAVSPDAAESYRSFLQDPLLPINVIGNPVFQVPKTSSFKIIKNNYILNVGRLERQKNQRLLIRAFSLVSKHFPGLNLIILGEGSLRHSLEQLISYLNLNDKVLLLGFKDDTSNYYQNASAFVLSSDLEGFGNVIVEALSYGIPVVSSDCPGGPNYILNRPGLGELCPVNNEQELAKAILKVLSNPDDYDCEAMLSRANDFSSEAIGSQYMALLNKVLL